MPRRVNSELLLVGSLPADSTSRRCGRRRGSSAIWCSRCPTGRPVPARGWVSYERERLVRPNEGIVILSETESPTGLPRHAYETPVFGIKPGVSELHWASWPRIDDAIASYAVFRELRAAGVIPDGVRFQVCLPFPASAMNAFKADFAHDYPIAARGFEDLVARELARLFAAIPPRRRRAAVGPRLRDAGPGAGSRLDVGGRLGALRRPGDAADPADPGRGAGRLPPVLRDVPRMADVRGTGHGPAGADGELRRRQLRAHRRLAAPGRPRYLRSEDRSFFRPLVDLEPLDARVFLGIVLPIDGGAGLRRRVDTASRYISDFGVAMYCGFGRQPGKDGTETMREHAEVVRAVRGAG